MHYRRWLRYGDPLHKRRARGVMDAPVTYPPGPAQLQLVRTLWENPGRVFPWYALGANRPSVDNALAKLRKKYGPNVILTAVKPRGYVMSRETAQKLGRFM